MAKNSTLINVEQRSDKWFEVKLARVSASRAKDVFTKAKKRRRNPETDEMEYPYLKGRDDYKKEIVSETLAGYYGTKKFFITEEMQWGINNESAARMFYKLKTKSKVTEEGFMQHNELMAGCSTDGLVDTDGNLEIKCLTVINHLYEIIKDDNRLEEYKPQMQFQLWITERKWCDFVGYDGRQITGLDLYIERVYRDEEYINMIEFEVRKFLSEVEQDINFFLQYIPLSQTMCLDCGVVSDSRLRKCSSCNSWNTLVTEEKEKAKKSLAYDLAKSREKDTKDE